MNPLWTTEDVARELRCSPRHARRLMREGHIEARKIANHWLTSEVCVMNYLDFSYWGRDEPRETGTPYPQAQED